MVRKDGGGGSCCGGEGSVEGFIGRIEGGRRRGEMVGLEKEEDEKGGIGEGEKEGKDDEEKRVRRKGSGEEGSLERKEQRWTKPLWRGRV